jgi:DNA repair exonuclease SbcCD ATPase subunit
MWLDPREKRKQLSEKETTKEDLEKYLQKAQEQRIALQQEAKALLEDKNKSVTDQLPRLHQMLRQLEFDIDERDSIIQTLQKRLKGLRNATTGLKNLIEPQKNFPRIYIPPEVAHTYLQCANEIIDLTNELEEEEQGTFEPTLKY